MFNFEDALAEYLSLYADVIRVRGYDIEYRGIQRQLQEIARIVKVHDVDALQLELEDLREWAKEIEV